MPDTHQPYLPPRIGLQRVLAPTVRECDKNVLTVSVSQHELTGHIDRLSHELEILVAAMPEPAVVEHAGRITAIQNRIEKVSGRIQSVNTRMYALKAEAFVMRRANLVRVAAEPLDELPQSQNDMYRSNDVESEDDTDEVLQIEGAQVVEALPVP